MPTTTMNCGVAESCTPLPILVFPFLEAASMQRSKDTQFVLSARQPLLLQLAGGVEGEDAVQQQAGSELVFSASAPAPAFAWLGNGRLSRPQLPFARVSSGIYGDPPASTDNLMKKLLSEQLDEPQGPKRGHTDEWYQQRCIFCASCKSTINSHYQKRGSRCQGCRRWFHAACMPATAPSSTAFAAAGSEPAADTQDEAAGFDGSSSSRKAKRRRNLFFHDDDCQEVFDVLAAVVAGGQQAFTLPDSRPFWQQLFNSQAPYQDHTWQVLDLSEVRHLYKDAQKRETLFRQHRKAQRQLDAAAQAAAEREEAAKRSRGFSFGLSSSSSGTGGAAQEAADAAAERKSVRPSSLHEFLIVSEVLKPLGETPRDLLEDSYAIITRDGRDDPAAVATFNVYGSDHARLQGVATPGYLQRQGHATRLLKQLELVLADAGVQDLVVILEPQDEKRVKPSSQLLPPETAQRWFRRLGFKSASSEAQMLWRRELPEYHKGLVGNCSLLAKPLPTPKAIVMARCKTAQSA